MSGGPVIAATARGWARARAVARVALVGIGLSLPHLLPAQERVERAPANATLVRCLDTADLACFRVAGDVSAARGDSTLLQARLDTTRLIGPGAGRRDTTSAARLQLLVVYDVSGSMIGTGSLFTRLALSRFFRAMPKALTVGLVPFGSRGVSAAFQQAAFGTPAEAERRLRQLPSPRPDANTALYSSIEEGLQLLDRRARPDGHSVLLVITDGRNDIRAGDDPGLLQGEAARDRVRQRIAASNHTVWLVGAGPGVNAPELDALAGDAANAATVDMDPVAIDQLLRRIVDEALLPTRVLVYGLPEGARSSLGRRNHLLALPALGAAAPIAWRPPFVALPPFEYVADRALVPRGVETMAAEGMTDLTARLSIGLPLLLLTVLSYLLLPRIIPDTGKQPSAAAPIPPPVSAKALRVVEEAPPRRPTDITLEGAA